jgi:DNA repair protein RadC
LDKLQEIEGVGPAKASLIAAALEFARRRIRPEGLKISFPPDVLPLIRHYGDRKQEHFICISLNGANEVVAHRVVSVGLVNKTQVHPREVFADPITDRASAIIVAHNHPSGELKPSKEDTEITKQMKAAGETLGIKLLDHIIFNQKEYYSFLEKGIL